MRPHVVMTRCLEPLLEETIFSYDKVFRAIVQETTCSYDKMFRTIVTGDHM